MAEIKISVRDRNFEADSAATKFSSVGSRFGYRCGQETYHVV